MDHIRLLKGEEISSVNSKTKKAEPQVEELLIRFLASLKDEAQGGRANDSECTEAAE